MNIHSNREEWLKTAVIELRPIFDSVSFALPDKIRVTCGFPSSRARANNRFIGEHWSPKASTDNHHEILISPVVDDPLQVFSTLVHELAHAATDGDGHRGRFPACVRKFYLEGKPTHTKIGDNFRVQFGDLVSSLGDYPHARLNVEADRKVQSTRMLKAVCPTCGYTIRLSKTWADKGLPTCSNDGSVFSL